MILIKKQKMLVVLIALSLFISGCGGEGNGELATNKSEILAFTSTRVQSAKLAINYATTGTVISDQRVDVASRATGYIQKILVHEGDTVVKGQLLIELDGADVEGAIRQVQASVNKARSALKDAQTDLQRFQALFERGSVSENQLRKITLQRDVAQDSLNEAKAIFQTTRSQRQYTRISSPVSGVVVVRHKRDGDLAAPAMPLLTLESSKGLLFETYVSEGKIKHIKQGDKVDVAIDALNASIQGTVARIVLSGDPVTRKSRIKISLLEHAQLLPGMFGRATFKLGSRESVVIERDSMVSRAGLEGVFVVDESNRVHFRWLRMGKAIGEKLEVLVGLKVGEQIVLQPDERLNDGDLIKQSGTKK